MSEVPCYDPGERTERRWRIPPPLTENASVVGPQGCGVLAEVEGPLGESLWTALRAVHLWATADPEETGSLFSGSGPADAAPDEVEGGLTGDASDALRTVHDILRDPEGADRRAVSEACRALADWAAGQGLGDTRVEFLQAAALACPADPRHALAIGRAHRDRAEYTKAGSWLHRTVGLARRIDDWDAYARAYVCLGKMAVFRGAYPEARKHFVKALRRAVREGLPEIRAAALHDLHVVESNTGNWDEARDYAQAALEAYGPGHPALVALASDVACQMVEQGFFDEAHPIFLAVRPLISPHRRPYVLGSLARTAGALGREEEWEDVREDLRGRPEGPGVAEAWVEVGQGALSLARWDDARDAAERGLKMARRREEGKVVLMAESVIEAAAHERRAEAAAPVHDSEVTLETDRLTERILGSLEAPAA